MKVYGVYKSSYDSHYGVSPLYLNKSDAYKKALELLEIEKEKTKKMQNFCKKEELAGSLDYRDWEP